MEIAVSLIISRARDEQGACTRLTIHVPPLQSVYVHGESRGSQGYSFKYLLRDTLHISGKSERPQSPEEAGNLFNFAKEAGFW